MMNKRRERLRRAKRSRLHIRELGAARLSVHKTLRHTYAQVISADGKTLASASTLDEEIIKKVKYTGNVEAAKLVGELVAKRATKVGVEQVAFDRSGYRYHGRVKALADAARESGLQF